MSMDLSRLGATRSDWTTAEVAALYALPLLDLLWHAQSVHRRHFDPNAVQRSTLLSIKTGACSEDCGYCSQSARYKTEVGREALLDVETVLDKARAARDAGATRFCMGAAWRGPKERDLEPVLAMIRGVRELGLETCVTLGTLSEDQARQLAAAGLDYYNHNLDTSESYYSAVVTTHSYRDRLNTLAAVRAAGLRICCGGILGLGENASDRIAMLHRLATFDPHPESVPINQLVPVAGTPLAGAPPPAALDFVRVIALARILMPRSHVRLSAGRAAMSEELQALCFLAGANSIFYGDRLLTTGNPDTARDTALFARLGLRPEAAAPSAG
ncbi:MAG: biotin synthase BioB [Gammaproteobacteria bacterium]|nr:biotin synthase BioB [Gammaproteobacteria bacterium]